MTFFGSTTRFNGEFLEAMKRLDGVEVRERAISKTVAPRGRGVLAYLALWLEVWRERERFAAVNLQFSALWPLELPFLLALREKLVFTVHNAVPHEFGRRQHAPTRWIAALARTLVFVSDFSRDDFIARYGERFRAKASVVRHGVSAAAPEGRTVAYAPAGPPEAIVYWSTVKPYKGVELFLELARSTRLRAAGIDLEIHGAWAPELRELRAELASLGVRIEDGFLDRRRLADLLARNVVFVLPHRRATQSGAMYTLLAHGKVFLAADVGDLGAFLRRHGLDTLVLRERSEAEVVAALERLARDEPAVVAALQKAQDESAWAETTRGIAAVYIPPAE